MSGSVYGLEALRRFREQCGQVEGPAEPVQADDDEDQVSVSEDDDADDFDDLFDAWIDFNMEVPG
ncbi:MAG: hypothetical protein LAP87_23745 [Acidobacteriia bacterium]|nr:hypothetical protein [Terriglobia bacterium]